MAFILHLIEIVLMVYFMYVVAYNAVLAIAGLLFYRKTSYRSMEAPKSDIAVFIPAYKEDQVIKETLQKVLKQNYPKSKLDIILIADSFAESTIKELSGMDIQVIEADFLHSTKVKSLQLAFSKIDKAYDIAIIIDADNVIENDFCLKMDYLYRAGYKSIQGNRKAKNFSTNLALLDGLSEGINAHVFKKGSVSLGLSSALAGSGMAFDFQILKEEINKMSSVGGFDRELELSLLDRHIKSYYAENAIVYDEKVGIKDDFTNQRKRWISSQYHYLNKYLKKGIFSLFTLNLSYFNSSVLRNIQLPRLLNLGILFLITLISIIPFPYYNFHPNFWLILFACNMLTILLSIPKEYFTKKTLLALIEIPGIFIVMLIILFNIKNANKRFIHTPHTIINDD